MDQILDFGLTALAPTNRVLPSDKGGSQEEDRDQRGLAWWERCAKRQGDQVNRAVRPSSLL